MLFLEVFLLRFAVWIGLPVLLLILALGPRRVGRSLVRAWHWLWHKRLDPEDILTLVVRQQQQHVGALRKVLERSEAAEADIARNLRQSKENINRLDEEAKHQLSRGDDLGARAALYKVHLERLAVAGFQDQLDRQREHITEGRRRLYLLELQLRQYEVGRSILLSQLAEARTVEQQFAIARNFDPFNAVAHWQKAEGMVQAKAQNARAVEQVFDDLAEIPLAGQPAQVDPAALDAQLLALKNRLGNINPAAN
jgi:phage shock protein A